MTIASKTASAGETSVTVGLSGARALSAIVYEYSSLGDLDAHNAGSTTTSGAGAISSQTLTPTDDVVCFAAFGRAAAADFVSAASASAWTNSFTEDLDQALVASANEDVFQGVAIKSGTSADTYQTDATIANQASKAFGRAIAAYLDLGSDFVPNSNTTVTAELNRLAGITDLKKFQDAQGAANVWAGTTGRDLVGALNAKAGNTDPKTFQDLQGICNVLASTTGLGPAEALSRVVA